MRDITAFRPLLNIQAVMLATMGFLSVNPTNTQIFITVLASIILSLIFTFIIKVQQNHVVVLEKKSKYHSTLTAGFHFHPFLYAKTIAIPESAGHSAWYQSCVWYQSEQIPLTPITYRSKVYSVQVDEIEFRIRFYITIRVFDPTVVDFLSSTIKIDEYLRTFLMFGTTAVENIDFVVLNTKIENFGTVVTKLEHLSTYKQHFLQISTTSQNL